MNSKKTILLSLAATIAVIVTAMVMLTQHKPETKMAIEAASQLPPAVGAENHKQAPTPARASEVAPEPSRLTPEEILKQLASIQIEPGPGQGRSQYRVMSLLEQLAQCGEPALPAIRTFLASNSDVAYNLGRGNGGGNRNRNTPNLLPPSLRFGLFDVVLEIGGNGAEQIFAEWLTSTTRGAEFFYLVQTLERMAPGKYRDSAIAAAKSLLASGKITDANNRNNVYDVLRQFNDTSYTVTAQAQWLLPDGKVDRSALRYLQQTLGDKSLALAAQALQSGHMTDADSKEAIGRVGLTYVGSPNDQANDQAVQLFHTAINDPSLAPEQRRNLIEDLNQDGLINERNPTPDDLKIISNRYVLAQTYLQQSYVQNDPVASAAFQEALKDLTQMLQRAGATLPTH
jgi:hypothetical protein